MEKNLLFFTSKFPYGVAETFIDNEVSCLSKNFDNIYVVSCVLEKGYIKQRELPKNFHVLDGYCVSSIDRNILAPLGAIGHLLDNDEKWKAVKQVERVGIKEKIYYGYTLSRANLQIRTILPQIKKLGLKPENTVIYSYWFNNFAYIASEVNRLLFNGDCKLITRAHRFDLYDLNRFYSPLKAIAAKRVDAVYACSLDGCEYLRQRYPLHKSKFHTAYLGTKDYGVESEKKDNVIRICSCSYIKPVKRVHLILEALSLIQNSDVEICWTHYGDGNNMAQTLQDRALEVLPGSIKADFVGEISNSELMKKYQDNYYDLFINVSESEGLPVSIMEAMSFGIPVIATDVGGTKEIVNKENGFLLPPDFSSRKLAETIENYIALDEVSKKEYRRNSRLMWEKNFNAEKNNVEFVEALKIK